LIGKEGGVYSYHWALKSHVELVAAISKRCEGQYAYTVQSENGKERLHLRDQRIDGGIIVDIKNRV
jgi:hypothetical protein